MKTITDQMLWDFVDGQLPAELAQEISSSTDLLLNARLEKIQQYNRQLATGFPALPAPNPALKARLLERYLSDYCPTAKIEPTPLEKWILLPLALFCFLSMLLLMALAGTSNQILNLVDKYSSSILLLATTGFCLTLSLFVLRFIAYNRLTKPVL
ncbi:hypothetical protein WG904_15280 [Pedobacter sp. Du54]|uniref:hypothetical protein n=1 Tax=Pedobacter anseongensis TaxID=3133439 RepID=UPI003095C186